MPQSKLLVYGANGYTGMLVAEEAARRGLSAVLAGRDRETVATLGERLGLESRIASLDDRGALEEALDGIAVVLHCAGPFVRTARPMVDACLARRVHYLDVTGEVEVFAALHRRSAEAVEAGILVMPGVGFDVVPSDGLAAHLARRLPGGRRLVLAFLGIGRPSRGTATTMAENAGRGGVIRREGQLVPVPAAWRTRMVDFGRGPRSCVSIPWGDVYTAHLTTGVPDIEVYMAAPAGLRFFLRASRVLGPLLASGPVQRLLKNRIRSGPPGPSAAEREAGSSHLWGELVDDLGNRVSTRLHGPEGYTATMLCALEICQRVLAGKLKTGFHTPGRALRARPRPRGRRVHPRGSGDRLTPDWTGKTLARAVPAAHVTGERRRSLPLMGRLQSGGGARAAGPGSGPGSGG